MWLRRRWMNKLKALHLYEHIITIYDKLTLQQIHNLKFYERKGLLLLWHVVSYLNNETIWTYSSEHSFRNSDELLNFWEKIYYIQKRRKVQSSTRTRKKYPKLIRKYNKHWWWNGCGHLSHSYVIHFIQLKSSIVSYPSTLRSSFVVLDCLRRFLCFLRVQRFFCNNFSSSLKTNISSQGLGGNSRLNYTWEAKPLEQLT